MYLLIALFVEQTDFVHREHLPIHMFRSVLVFSHRFRRILPLFIAHNRRGVNTEIDLETEAIEDKYLTSIGT